ncbi:hypothetical protein ACFLTM_02500 [Candidatus Bipolaricaulota bacterium]
MRRRRLRIQLPLVVLILATFASFSARADVLLDLSADPASVVRGGELSYEVQIENGGPGAVEGATLYLPLPAGIDQLAADVRVDGGAWDPYPANGLFSLAPLPAGGQREFEIRTQIELGAPGSLPTIAEVLHPTGPLAEAFVEVNVLPSVDAGPDVIAEFGGTVDLAGTSAGDGGDGLATIEWTDGGGGGSFDDPSTLHPVYTPPAISGLLELTLRVVDHNGGEASDLLRVRVNAPPIVGAGPDLLVDGGETVALDDASASDADGWIVTHAWDDGGAGGTFLPSADVLNPTYHVPVLDPCCDGEIGLTLIVTDDWGGVASDLLRLIWANPSHPPIVDAGTDQAVDGGSTVRLDGSATDEDGDLASIWWVQSSGPAVDLLGGATAELEFAAPEVEASVDLVFRLHAVDACRLESVDDVTVVVAPIPTFGSVALDVSIKAFDAWGLPLSALDPLEDGDAITFVVEVTNIGEELLTGLSGWSDVGVALSFAGESLGPWARGRAEFVYLVDAARLDGRLRIAVDVRATGPDGSHVTGGDSILFFLDQAESALSLEKTVDRTEAAVGETVTYTYTIRNEGAVTIKDLDLVDDRLGPIPLPRGRIEPGEVSRVTISYEIQESDLPGPLMNMAFLSGFGTSGVGTEAASAISIDVAPSVGGAGGEAVSTLRPVVISEIAWAGSKSDPTAEWIELVNVSDGAIDLYGWSLRWLADPTAPENGWRVVELSGTIDPLPTPFSDRVDSLHRLTSARQGEGWKVFDVSWWGVGGSGRSASGFYILERGSDSVIGNIVADLIYDPSLNLGLELPDEGTVVFLHAPDGTIVDSANASSRAGWAAGSAASGATMERVNLLRSDDEGNWQTSPGILTNGRDAFGRRLAGTAGMPNSPSMETLIAFAASETQAQTVVSQTSIPIPHEGASEIPWIYVTLVGETVAGGGGATAPSLHVTTRRTGSETWIDLDPSQWPSETIYIWVVNGEGEVFLLSLVRET